MNPAEASDPPSGSSEPAVPGGIEIRVLPPGEEAILARVEAGVFDRPVDDDLLREVLGDRRHHLAVAIETRPDGPLVVGMATALDYVHPDKPPELWVDEVGVAPDRRGRGIGKRLVEALFEVGRRTGCRQAWVLTDRTNRAARALFASLGGVEAAGEPMLLEIPLTTIETDRDG